MIFRHGFGWRHAHTLKESQTKVQAWKIIQKHYAQFERRNRLLTEEVQRIFIMVIHTLDNQFVICSFTALFITFYFKSLAHFYCILLVNKLRTDENWKLCSIFASDYCEACTVVKMHGAFAVPAKIDVSSTKTNWALLKCMNRPMTFIAEIKTNWKRYDFILLTETFWNSLTIGQV